MSVRVTEPGNDPTDRRGMYALAIWCLVCFAVFGAVIARNCANEEAATAAATATTPPPVAQQIQKACDTDTGNLIYWAEGAGVSVVTGGCIEMKKGVTAGTGVRR